VISDSAYCKIWLPQKLANSHGAFYLGQFKPYNSNKKIINDKQNSIKHSATTTICSSMAVFPMNLCFFLHLRRKKLSL